MSIVFVKLQGQTRMLLTSIPYFREVIIMSFRCEHCGFENNEIQSAGSIRRMPSPSFHPSPILHNKESTLNPYQTPQPKEQSTPPASSPAPTSTAKSSNPQPAPSPSPNTNSPSHPPKANSPPSKASYAISSGTFRSTNHFEGFKNLRRMRRFRRWWIS